MLVNQNMGNLSGIFNEANRLLSDSNNINSITKSQKIQPTQQENEEEKLPKRAYYLWYDKPRAYE